MAVSGKGFILTGLLGRGRGTSQLVNNSPNSATPTIVTDALFTPFSGNYTFICLGGSYSITGQSAILSRTNNPAILQTAYTADDVGSSTTIATTITGVTAGSALVVLVGYGSAVATISGVSDGTAYTAAADGACIDSVNTQSSRVYYLLNAGSGSHTVTATFSTSVTGRRIRVVEVSGIATTAAEDKSANQQQNAVGTTTDSISSSATAATSNANDFVLGLTQDTSNGDPGTGTLSAGTGYTLSGANQIIGVEGKLVSSTGAQTATFTDTKNANRTTHVLALKTTISGGGAYTLTASGGAYSLGGAQAILNRSKLVTASGGSYTLTGANANLVKGRVLTAQGGAYSLAGASANLLRSKNIVASGGVYTLTGSSAIISKSKLLVASGGVYNLTGASAVITYTAGSAAYTLICQGGSYSLTGASVSINRNRNLTVQGGSYSLGGGSANLYRSRILLGQGGTYSLTGATATLLKSKNLVATGGSYTLTGASSTILRSKLLVASSGTYNLTGSSAVITWASVGGAVYPPIGSVLLGVTYGPTGTEYTGTLDIGKKFRIDIATGNIVMIIDKDKVMSL